MLPNLLDDLLRAWDTQPPTQEAPTKEVSPDTPQALAENSPADTADLASASPDERPQQQETSSGSGLELPATPAFIAPPQTLLPSDPFGTLLAEFTLNAAPEPQIPTTEPAPNSGSAMDSLLSSLLANFDPTPVEELKLPEPVKAPPPIPDPPARPSLPAALTAPVGRKFVAVALGEHRLALPVESVLEVGRCPKITFVPGLEDHIQGVFSFRGEVMPVVNIRALAGMSEPVGQPSDFAAENSRIAAVQSANGRIRAALLFDSLEGIVWIDTDAPGLASAASRLRDTRETHPLASSLSKVCLHDNIQFAIVSVDRLLEEAGCTEGVAA